MVPPFPRLVVVVLVFLCWFLKFKSINSASTVSAETAATAAGSRARNRIPASPQSPAGAREGQWISVLGVATSSRIPIPEFMSESKESFQVLVDVSVVDIEKIDGTSQEMAVRLQMRQYWKDLTLTAGSIKDLFSRVDKGLSNSSGSGGQNWSPIWIPDTIVANQRSSHRTGERDNAKNQFVLKYNNQTGELEKSEWIFTVIKCEPMDFTRYPFDYQMCTLLLRSASFTGQQRLQYKWSWNHGDDTGGGNELGFDAIKPYDIVSLFQVVQILMHQPNTSTAITQAGAPLQLGIQVRRLWSAYIHPFYLPMTIFVATSLLSLWLVHPKISFVMNFINIVSMNIYLAIWDLHSDIPKLPYCTAMDAYAIICFVFIILILMLNVYILFYIKSDDDASDDGTRHNQSFQSSQEQKYFLPKQDESRSFRMRHPHPFVRTIHSRSSGSGSSPVPNAGGGGGLEHTAVGLHQPVEVAESPVEVVIRRKSSSSQSTWSCVREKLLDTIRRSGHTLFLFLFIAIFILYWIILLSIYYS